MYPLRVPPFFVHSLVCYSFFLLPTPVFGLGGVSIAVFGSDRGSFTTRSNRFHFMNDHALCLRSASGEEMHRARCSHDDAVCVISALASATTSPKRLRGFSSTKMPQYSLTWHQFGLSATANGMQAGGALTLVLVSFSLSRARPGCHGSDNGDMCANDTLARRYSDSGSRQVLASHRTAKVLGCVQVSSRCRR